MNSLFAEYLSVKKRVEAQVYDALSKLIGTKPEGDTYFDGFWKIEELHITVLDNGFVRVTGGAKIEDWSEELFSIEELLGDE